MARQSVASWYWNITAILSPFVLLVTLMWMFYTQQIQSYQSDAQNILEQVKKNHKQLEPLVAEMNDTAGFVGFDAGDPMANKTKVDTMVPKADRSVGGEERTKPRDKQSIVLQRYLDAENLFYGGGGGDSEGMVYEYAAARKWIQDYELKLRQYIAYKSTQYYTVQTIDVGGATIAVAGGDLKRPGTTDTASGIYKPEDASVMAAWERARVPGYLPADKVMQPPTRITLELVFRRQHQLLRDLMAANQHQYNLLYAEVSGFTEVTMPDGSVIVVGLGFEGEEQRQRRVRTLVDGLKVNVNSRKELSAERLRDVHDATETAITETTGRKTRLDFMVVAAVSRIEGLQAEFETEKTLHEGDGQKFADMVRNLPRIKTPIKLEKGDPDGEVSYSDYGRGVCHIDLGSSDGVKAGQRFEIWRIHGRDRDELIGVVEIVRALSAHYSLCTVLSLVNVKEPVRKGDKLISHLWHAGRFLTVAMHGEFEPPNQSYTKERLAELLKQMGCRVADKVQPGVDLVILGSNLFGDEWYRDARNDLRFSTLKEDAIRLYVDPR